jgi:Domain of Unknown Function (DUF1206)
MASTSTEGAPVREARARGDQLERTDTFEGLARAGLVARGVVYAIIGVLALKLALGDGGDATNQQGALQKIAEGPFGKVLLALVAVGLIGYATWRLVRAALGHGPEQRDDTKDRIASLVSGIAYAALSVTAIKILFGSGGGGSGAGDPDKATGGVLDWPAGQVLVAIAGLVFIGVAIDQARKGLTRQFLEDSKTEQMSEQVRSLFTLVGVVGLVARAVVFALIGWFLVRAALDYDPDKAVGLDGALAKLGQSTYGPLALGIVAAGFIAFAVYSVCDARYRRI